MSNPPVPASDRKSSGFDDLGPYLGLALRGTRGPASTCVPSACAWRSARRGRWNG